MNENANHTYRIRRAWTAVAKGCDETVSVWENGTYSDFLTKNWAMFVETILPSALARFFFFDGEKIAELATDANHAQMKDAIGDEYTLCYDEKTKSTAILKGYFQKYADETSAAVQSGEGSARAPQDENGH